MTTFEPFFMANFILNDHARLIFPGPR